MMSHLSYILGRPGRSSVHERRARRRLERQGDGRRRVRGVQRLPEFVVETLGRHLQQRRALGPPQEAVAEQEPARLAGSQQAHQTNRVRGNLLTDLRILEHQFVLLRIL